MTQQMISDIINIGYDKNIKGCDGSVWISVGDAYPIQEQGFPGNYHYNQVSRKKGKLCFA